MAPTLRTLAGSLAVSLTVSFAACLPPPLKDCTDTGCTAPPPATSGGESGVPTSSTSSDESQTVSGDLTTGSFATTTTSTTTTDATSTGDEQGAPPSILDEQATPPWIASNGKIQIDAETMHAEGVQMQLDTGKQIELKEMGSDSFHGEIEVFTGVDNGNHIAVLTPWRGDVFGDPVEVDYTVQLPVPGEQEFWEAGDLIGPGKVAALGVLPDGLLVELGSFIKDNQSHCYLRRRQLDGTWFDADFIELLPGPECTAIDMKIDRELGTIHVVVEREGGDGLRWWLGEIASWGKGAKNNGLGAVGDKAEALALKDGTVAVCGATPFGNDLDAAAWVLGLNKPMETLTFDWLKQGFMSHKFAETAHDCVFVNDVLVLVGEAFGSLNDDGDPKRNHRFVLEHDRVINFDIWTVAGVGPGTQSRAFAVDVDDKGRYIVAGITCGDVCEPDGELRIYQPGGKVDWQVPLGPLNTDLAGPHDVAWSPAGHMVVALAEFNGQAFSFRVQAYAPDKLDPLWIFVPEDMKGLQVAFALAIGELGEVYAGGMGADNYPAVAYIAG